MTGYLVIRHLAVPLSSSPFAAITLRVAAAKRVRQLRKGAEPTIVSKNKDSVVALREIAAANVVISKNPATSSDEVEALLPEGRETDEFSGAEEEQESSEG